MSGIISQDSQSKGEDKTVQNSTSTYPTESSNTSFKTVAGTKREGCTVDRELGPVRTNTGPTVKQELGLQKSLAGQRTFDLK